MVDKHLNNHTPSVKALSSFTLTSGKETLTQEEPHPKYGTLDPFASMPLTNDATVTPDSSSAVIEYLIFDCSALSYVDLSGTKVLTSLYNDLVKKGVTLVLANCSEPLIKQLDRCSYFKAFPRTQMYPSILDAVMTLQHLAKPNGDSSLDSPIVP